MGKSDRRELHSQIYRMVPQLAKMQFSHAIDPRRGWRESITDGRVETELVLADSPSLRPLLAQFVATQMPKAIARAMSDVERFDEVDEITTTAMQQARYTVDRVLGGWFPSEPAQPSEANRL